MRLKMGLLIVLIGMIFTTAFGHTTEPIQKQKTVFVISVLQNVTETANVLVSYFVVTNYEKKEILISNNFATTVYAIDDVGWNNKVSNDVCKLQKTSFSVSVPLKYKRAPRDKLSC